MARQIKSFINDAAIQAAIDDKSLDKPYVALDEETGKIDWNSKEETPDYASMYLTIEALEDGQLRSNGSNVSFSVNNGEWFTTANYVTLTKGDIVRLKSTTFCSQYSPLLFADNPLSCNIYGNIMSLGYNDNFQGQSQLPDYAYNSLFYEWSGIVSVENLILPATTLASNCYGRMFQGCTSLTKAPALPATTLAISCYFQMFLSTNITAAPELPATTLASNCYWNMFFGCSSLNYIKCLATDISATGCTSNWVYGVASTGTFVKAAGVEWPAGISGIPSGWTVIEE